MIPLVDRECNHWVLPIFKINVHQVGIPPIIDRICHHWMIPLVEINVHHGLPLVDSGDQRICLVKSGDQGPMDPSNHIFLPLVERDRWKVMHVLMPYQRD